MELQKKFPQIEIVDQLHFKTLGSCLADLMKRVKTEWFVYLHSDIRITPHAFKIMEMNKGADVGIIESERLHWDGTYNKYLEGVNDLRPKKDIEDSCELKYFPQYTYTNYYNRNRSFSGLQLFQKKSIEPLLERIEDDFIYRNEDIIFQSECFKNKYKYVKTFAIHIHQTINKNWTFNDLDTNIMQWKGIVKYTIPNEINLLSVILPLKKIKHLYNLMLMSVLDFCWCNNPNWAVQIIKYWDHDLSILAHSLEKKGKDEI